ncbi:AbrB family transcriptional regulator [Microvirga tunisiensis]|uniref:AbrB family transcriptional regulator n=2 Tax=Pannonibacter tanglangensis TaxID=2750084 RepID=A0A7X5J9S0_9HYPH|nr:MULTISPECIES: AbrB family transcriptional regulator [unclassified Pannonibacter]NBN64248.1 AbrB family transcriptional regulator [Pannonibacter sp. XCT-34]NBN78781.1 AbrB family transcriptional regulator [Pannonibacter sp. XCT-53]
MTSQPSPAARLRHLFYTLGVGTLGSFGFAALGLPAAWLSGAMIAVAAGVLLGMPSHFPLRLRDGIFVLMGVTMGSGVTPEVVERVADWPLSMLGLAIVVVAVMAGTFLFLQRVAGWERETAYFAAIPGALSFVIAMATDRKTDVARVAASQTIRLFFLVAVLPGIIVGATPQDQMPVLVPPAMAPWPQFALAMALCLAGSLLAQRVGFPGGWLTGAFFVSAGLNGSGLLNTHVPDPLMIPCFIALGAMIGTRFADTRPRELLRLLAASVGAFAVGFVLSALGAVLVSQLLGLPLGQVLLAYAPGGLEVMMLIAFLLDMDPAYVAAHQLARYIALVLILPLVTLLVLGRARSDADPAPGDRNAQS